MVLVLGKNYRHDLLGELERRKIGCITAEQAGKEDIRELRVGILNIMPKAETYEFSLLYPLGASVLQVVPVWLRLRDHEYSSTDKEHLDNNYLYFDQAIAEKSLDGLIITGAPVEDIPFEEVTYWNEITGIMNYARGNIVSTLGLCWGGLAMAKHLGIDKIKFEKKLFGVFEAYNLTKNRGLSEQHEVMYQVDDVFYHPQSRHSGIEDSALETAQSEGRINLLAHSLEAGYTIFDTPDRRFLMNLGHFEYDRNRLVEEYKRDMKQGRTDVCAPKNVDLEHPVNVWRSTRQAFFSGWIKFMHDNMQGNGKYHR
jgi:homoserine O-succinyltransferase